MYVNPISTRFVRGRSMPAIRAISLPLYIQPCRCLCFWFEQITRTTPRRRTILHLSQIRLTDALTFITESLHLLLLAMGPHPHRLPALAIGSGRLDRYILPLVDGHCACGPDPQTLPALATARADLSLHLPA